MISDVTAILSGGKDLQPSQMEAVMEEIMSGQAQTPDIVAFLSELSKKGETVEEIAAAVTVMRRHAVRIHTKQAVVLDTCGTGGDCAGTFNISTCAAFVAAGCGIAVAKHGNRSVSSPSGSADILEALGVNINLGKDKIERCLNEVGIAFLFAQGLHPAMKYAMEARKEIGRRTIFNILGPLSNPASATHQLIGVFSGELTEVLAKVLARLGTKHALVVHGEDGLDEATTCGKTQACESLAGKIKNYQLDPLELGFEKADPAQLKGAGVAENAKTLIDILQGREQGAKRDIVVLNSACAIYASDKAKSIKEGTALAEESLGSGSAYKKFELLREYSLLT